MDADRPSSPRQGRRWQSKHVRPRNLPTPVSFCREQWCITQRHLYALRAGGTTCCKPSSSLRRRRSTGKLAGDAHARVARVCVAWAGAGRARAHMYCSRSSNASISQPIATTCAGAGISCRGTASISSGSEKCNFTNPLTWGGSLQGCCCWGAAAILAAGTGTTPDREDFAGLRRCRIGSSGWN